MEGQGVEDGKVREVRMEGQGGEAGWSGGEYGRLGR